VLQVVPNGEALARLLGGEDVLELLEADRRPVAQLQVLVDQTLLVRQALEPLHALAAEHRRVRVQSVACRLVVVRVVHPSRDGSVVVAQDGLRRELSHQLGAVVRRTAVTDRVPEAVVDVDLLTLVGLDYRAKGLVVRVDV
jgi:hypothetical protein